MTGTSARFDEPSARAAVTVEVGPRVAALPRGYGLDRYLDEARIPSTWCPRRGCLTIPVDRVADLLALLELRDRRIVELLAVDR